ncbi:MAG: heparin lyase I family protein [Alphaproteobacteria bacterium]
MSLTIVSAFSLSADDEAVVFFEGFESERLDQWWTGQLHEGEFWWEQDVVRHGEGALAIRVDPENRACGSNCQRNEVRVADQMRLPFGADAWYGFSFRVESKDVPNDSVRWVMGQWKQQNGRSPFLAQRYDNRIFHITIQDKTCRITIASASGNPDGMAWMREDGPSRPSEANANSADTPCNTDVALEWGADPILPDPGEGWVDMIYHVVGGPDGTGRVEVWANGRFVVRASGSIGYDDADGPDQYFKFGIYRNVLDSSAVAYLDNFRRGGSYEDVDPAQLAP